MNVFLAVVSGAAVLSAVFFLGCEFGDKRREEKILKEYLTYIPIGEIGDIEDDLMNEDGLSENFPMLIVMPSNYDYFNGNKKDRLFF